MGIRIRSCAIDNDAETDHVRVETLAQSSDRLICIRNAEHRIDPNALPLIFVNPRPRGEVITMLGKYW